MKWITAKQLKSQLKVTGQTLYNWRKTNKIIYKQLNKRSFLYDIDSICNNNILNSRKNIAYSRVSNTKQKDDLIRQEESIRKYASENGIKIDEYLSEIASGMNEDRKQFNKLIDSVIRGDISKIYITYKDRLTRFGFSYFENLFKKFDCEIVILNTTSETTFEQEITQDLISIIHHFSMKMYSNRRMKMNKLLKEIEKDNEND